jgi:hypothetical protein
MIVLKLELWPLGDETRAREIGRTYIANDGQASAADPRRGDYVAAVCRRGTTAVPRELGGQGKATRSTDVTLSFDDEVLPDSEPVRGEVKDYPRQAYNVWRLVIRALRACFPEER